MCSTPAATPRTVVDALVRIQVLVRAGMLDSAFAFYREMFRSNDSPIAQDVRSSPFLCDNVLDSFFDTAIKLNFKRLLVLLPFTEAELRALEKNMLSKNLAVDAAALHIAQGRPDRVQQLAGSQKKDPILATLARNMQMTESQQQQQLGSLSFSLSMVAAPMDTSLQASTISVAAATADDDEMKDGRNHREDDLAKSEIGTGNAPILLSMKSPKRTPNRLPVRNTTATSTIVF